MKWKFFYLFFYILASQQVQSQCDNSLCTMNSNILGVKFLGASPGKVTVGKKTQVVIEANNTGTCAWTYGIVYMRVTVAESPSGSSASAYQRDELVPDFDLKVNEKIDPRKNETFIYDIEIKADTKPKFPPGRYVLKFTLICKGKPFGEVLTEDVMVVDLNTKSGPCKMESAIVPGNVNVPAKVFAGKKYPVTVFADNIGTCVWEAPKNKIDLRVKVVAWASGVSTNEVAKLKPERPLLPEERTEIEQDQIASFGYDLVAPNFPGVYVLEFQLSDNGKLFGARCQKKVEVIGDAKKCDIEANISVTGIPPEMVYNKEYAVVVRIQNSGICSWVPASKIVLQCKVKGKPPGSPSQLPGLTPENGIYPVGSNTIESGKYFEVRYKVKGPYMPGNYELTWEIFKEGSTTGITEEKTFKVVAPK